MPLRRVTGLQREERMTGNSTTELMPPAETLESAPTLVTGEGNSIHDAHERPARVENAPSMRAGSPQPRRFRSRSVSSRQRTHPIWGLTGPLRQISHG